MIQAYIRVNHIIHGKVWNCRIQVFSKLVESEYPGFQFLHIGTDAPNLQWVWPQRHGNRKVQYLCSRKRTTVKEKKNSCMNFFFFLGTFLFFGNFLFFWSMVAQNASQHPEVVQNRGHGPGARASPALDPWTWLKQYS